MITDDKSFHKKEKKKMISPYKTQDQKEVPDRIKRYLKPENTPELCTSSALPRTPVWKRSAHRVTGPHYNQQTESLDQSESGNSVFFRTPFLYRSINSQPFTPKPQVVISPCTRTDEHLDTTHLHQNTKNNLGLGRTSLLHCIQ